jgi:hypothetical protein
MKKRDSSRSAFLNPRVQVVVILCIAASSIATFNRTELDDPALQLEEPVWGEGVEVLNR